MPSGGRKVEDPRPIRDKAYMSKSIRKLIIYLSEHGYDRSISSQILTSPTTKDFLAIISFLLANVDANFKFIGKFEDEIPSVLKLVGYPTTVGRSALTAIGNPTSWPQLLAALSWLTDLLKVCARPSPVAALELAHRVLDAARRSRRAAGPLQHPASRHPRAPFA